MQRLNRYSKIVGRRKNLVKRTQLIVRTRKETYLEYVGIISSLTRGKNPIKLNLKRKIS